jgi:Flp pilus assembly protein TadB
VAVAQAVESAPIERIGGELEKLAEGYASELERAAIVLTPQQSRKYTAAILGAVLAAWALYAVMARPSFVMGAFWLIAFCGIAAIGVRMWIRRRIATRLAQFNNQLEMVLRLIVSALRVGLGLRQAVGMVINDMPAPANVEFGRALAQTAIGVPIEDALDQLARRMPSTEMMMLAKAIKIQSRTGGNLAKILLNLAEMVKQRRRIERRIRSLTSESRSTRYVITALPVSVTAFILIFESDMREGLLGTLIGHAMLAIAAGLLMGGWFLFGHLSKIDV